MSEEESKAQEPVTEQVLLEGNEANQDEEVEVSESFAASNKRLYINNVSYHATEEDFKELLKEFEVLSVLIPSQTVRGFNVVQQRSFGIAYVDFKTEKDTEKAKVEINGKLLYNRPLRVKNFVPYQPKVQVKASKVSRRHSFFHRSHKSETKSTENKVTVPVTVSESDLTGAANEKEPETTEKSSEVVDDDKLDQKETVIEGEPSSGKLSINLSTDTVFIGYLSPKISDGELRAFFHDYEPTEVFIFKSRPPRGKQFFSKRRHVSALVVLTTSETLETVFEKLADLKLKGKKVELKAAHLGKIEAVRKAALIREKMLHKLELQAKGAATAALTATTEVENSSPLDVTTGESSPSVEEAQPEDQEAEQLN